MKVVIYQSFRTKDVPQWISRCMMSVKKWANYKKFEYRFFDDEMFDYVPNWYRDKVKNQIHLVSDLARLIIADEILKGNADQAIWIDADVFIFDPENFELPHAQLFSFCREVYIHLEKDDRLTPKVGVNNAITLMSKGNSFLPFYIDACKAMVANNSGINRTAVGTKFLTAINRQFPIDHIRNVGLFSPYVTYDIAKGGGKALDLYNEYFKYPIYAVNLCFTFNNAVCKGIEMRPSLFDTVIDKLEKSKGLEINRGNLD